MTAANNVLVLMSDEHTRSVMGAYGNQQVQTPTLDKLAASGVRFDNAYMKMFADGKITLKN